MQGINYIAKVGMAGVLLWVIFLGVMLHRIVNMEKKKRWCALPAVYLVTAVLADVQFQAIFGSLTMAAAVFMFLDIEYKSCGSQNENAINIA